MIKRDLPVFHAWRRRPPSLNGWSTMTSMREYQPVPWPVRARAGDCSHPAWPTPQGDTLEDADTPHDVHEPHLFSEEAFYPASYAHRPCPAPGKCSEIFHTAKPKQSHGRGKSRGGGRGGVRGEGGGARALMFRMCCLPL